MKSYLFPKKPKENTIIMLSFKCNERCDGILCKQFQPSYLENE
jgi:hypothetical protein